MKKDELIRRAKTAVQCLLDGGPAEDSFMEFKAAFPDVGTPEGAARTARHLAGQANAVAPDAFVWVIGVDEKARTIPGADKKELSNWYSRVSKCFNGAAPAMALSAIVHDFDKPIVAILFEPTDSPYVVNVPNNRDRVVPWREATGLRCASRSELLGLLRQTTLLPTFRIIEGSKRTNLIAHARPKTKDWSVRLHVTLYMENQTARRIVVPAHDFVGWFEVPDQISRTAFTHYELWVQKKRVSQVVIRDAEQLDVYAGVALAMPAPREMPAVAQVSLPVVGAKKPLVVDVKLRLRVPIPLSFSQMQAAARRRVTYL